MASRKRAVQGHAQRYGVKHRRTRAQWAPHVEAGRVTCWRCGKVIRPGAPWDLGHADDDPGRHMGPEHAACNRSAAARKVNGARQVERGRYVSCEW